MHVAGVFFGGWEQHNGDAVFPDLGNWLLMVDACDNIILFKRLEIKFLISGIVFVWGGYCNERKCENKASGNGRYEIGVEVIGNYFPSVTYLAVR
jgi:hypothetical protein